MQQLVIAVGNLVENAVGYSPEHSRVVVDVRHSAPDDHDPDGSTGFVELAVSDQGVGIPQQELDRVFERFYRVDRARSRETGGTGLGLSIVKHVAASHGGAVAVWSVEGEGSTFTIRLPLRGDTASGEPGMTATMLPAQFAAQHPTAQHPTGPQPDATVVRQKEASR
ncbi:MAG: sensor histidine kinase, partial [Actinopolymorphaceae bacterium]